MIRASYSYIESKVAPELSFISKALGIGYAAAFLIGIGMIFSGYFLIGAGCIAGAAVLFLIAYIYNKDAEKTINAIIENRPDIVAKLSYEEAIEAERFKFTNKEISSEEFDRRKELLEKEMISEIRKYKPDYKLGDKL